MQNGNYVLEWWDPYTGKIMLTSKVNTAKGQVKIVLPTELKSDIAFKLRKTDQ
jgi:hypothetical protein